MDSKAAARLHRLYDRIGRRIPAARGFLAWVAAAGVLLLGWRLSGIAHPPLFLACSGILIALATVFGLPPLRRNLVSRFAMPAFARVLPRLGSTERIALEAGTVWWDGDLFGGMPDWDRLLAFQPRPLDAAEQEADQPLVDLCTHWIIL